MNAFKLYVKNALLLAVQTAEPKKQDNMYRNVFL